MIRFVAPAMAVMNRLTYAWKFTLISIAFSIPLFIVLTQYLVNVEQNVNFSAKERLGVEYLTPLVDLMALAERYFALTSATLNGAEIFTNDLEVTRQNLENQIKTLDAVDARLGSVLQVSEAYTELKAAWQRLQTDLPSLNAEAVLVQHDVLSGHFVELIELVANNSNLVLDPDIDSYYLMHALIHPLPSLGIYFGQLQTHGLAALASGKLSPSDQTRLTIYAGQAEADMDEMISMLGYAFAKNPAVEQQLTETINGGQEKMMAFFDLLNTMLLGVTFNQSAGSAPALQTYFTVSQDAMDTGLAMYNQIANSLDTLLVNRVTGIVQVRTVVLAITLVALLVASYAISGFYFSVTKTITVIERAAERIVHSKMPGDLVLESRDELARAAVAFNNVAKGLDLARREAVEATRMKDLFLATMSHELRTPLNAMIGFLHLMIYSGQMDDDNVHMAERSLANTHRLLTLINNILDLSRIATGGLEIVPGPLSIRHLAAGLYNDLKPMANEKELRLDLEVDKDLPETINQDETRISQIVTNLVTNAIKFTDKGSIELIFKRRDDRFVIQVKDTGVGIPQIKQHLIFDDFFQVDSTSTRKQQGAGLGLAIVRRLTLLMNGTINVASEVDHGSTFTVELPLDLPAYQPGDRHKHAVNVFASSMSAGRSESVPVAQAEGIR